MFKGDSLYKCFKTQASFGVFLCTKGPKSNLSPSSPLYIIYDQKVFMGYNGDELFKCILQNIKCIQKPLEIITKNK